MADEDPTGWSLTESDPLVFTQLLQEIGVRGLQVDDLYSLDAETLESLQPIHALVFLFKWVPQTDDAEKKDDEASKKVGGQVVSHEESQGCGIYFANQVSNNACATLATMNAVMNIPEQKADNDAETIAHGPELDNLAAFGAGMDPMTLGHVIDNSDVLRTTHNSFSTTSPFSISRDQDPNREKEDSYHFITYVPKMGCVWELDGLKGGAVRHGSCQEGEGWVRKATEVIQERIATYPAGSLMFNLLAIRSAAIPRLERLIASPDTPASIIPQLQDSLIQEQQKVHQMKFENGLRRSNLVGTILACLRQMSKEKVPGDAAGKSKLEEAVEKARIVGKEKREKRMKGMDVDM